MCEGSDCCVLCYPHIQNDDVDSLLESERRKCVSALEAESDVDDRCFILGDFILWRQELLLRIFIEHALKTRHTAAILSDIRTQYRRKMRTSLDRCSGKQLVCAVQWHTPLFIHSVPFVWILEDKDASIRSSSTRLFILSPRKDVVWKQKPYLLAHSLYVNVVHIVYK